jgi:hypothetical protein
VGARLRAAERRRDRSSIGSRKSMARETFNRLSGVPGAASTPGGGGSSGGGGGGSTRTTTTTTPGVDNSLARLALVQSFLGNKNADVLDFAAQAKGLADVPGTTSTQTERLPGSSSGGGSGSASFSTPPAQSGVASFEGKKVAAWIKPALVYARNHGWKGQVNSGYRSFADQTRIYNSGVRPAAKPGTSNHEGTDFPRGAVDVSDAQTLARILARSPYGKRLKWAGEGSGPFQPSARRLVLAGTAGATPRRHSMGIIEILLIVLLILLIFGGVGYGRGRW